MPLNNLYCLSLAGLDRVKYFKHVVRLFQDFKIKQLALHNAIF